MTRWTEPVFPALPVFPPDDVLGLVADEHLQEMRISLHLGCGRSKSILRRRHRIYVCFLNQVLQLEAGKRGLGSPFVQ